MSDKALHTVMRLVPAFMVSILCLMFQGCGKDEPVSPAHGEGTPVTIGFRIRLSDNYGAMRAGEGEQTGEAAPDTVPDPGYEDGVGYENYIGFEDLDMRFLLFDGDGKFIENMTPLNSYAVGQSVVPTEYMVTCLITDKPANGFKVVVLANWGHGNYPQDNLLAKGSTTIAGLFAATGATGNHIFSFPAAGFTPSAETPIPMYGVRSSNIELKPDIINELDGEIELIRALAKVEIICNPEAAAAGAPLELESVTLTNHYDTGHCAPAGMDGNTDYTETPTVPATARVVATPLPFAISADKTRAVVYIPEYANKTAQEECVMHLKFADVDRTYEIRFREYDDGKPTAAKFDILRNHCYHFTVDLLDELEVRVKPYGVVTLTPQFGWDWTKVNP